MRKRLFFFFALVFTTISLANSPGLPLGSNVIVMTPCLPGATGACGKSATVQPQLVFTSRTTNAASPSLVKTKSYEI